MDKRDTNFPENHQYKRYLGEKSGDLKREIGSDTHTLRECMKETADLAFLPEDILKSSR